MLVMECSCGGWPNQLKPKERNRKPENPENQNLIIATPQPVTQPTKGTDLHPAGSIGKVFLFSGNVSCDTAAITIRLRTGHWGEAVDREKR